MKGILSLEDLRQRCRIDSETGCWLWAGALSANTPRAWFFHPEKARFQCMPAARAAWLLARGPIGGRVVYHALCSETICVNPLRQPQERHDA